MLVVFIIGAFISEKLLSKEELDKLIEISHYSYETIKTRRSLIINQINKNGNLKIERVRKGVTELKENLHAVKIASETKFGELSRGPEGQLVNNRGGNMHVVFLMRDKPSPETLAALDEKADGLFEQALEKINNQRAGIGAAINQMAFGADNLTNVSSNATQSRSTIMDTDYALATTQLAKTQIIQQAATAMLAQANQQPQSVLSLLR